MGTPDVQIPMTLALVKEVTIKGSFRYGVSAFVFTNSHSILHALVQPGDYPFAISLVTQGKVDLKALVTHRSVLSFANKYTFGLTTTFKIVSRSNMPPRRSRPSRLGSQMMENL